MSKRGESNPVSNIPTSRYRQNSQRDSHGSGIKQSLGQPPNVQEYYNKFYTNPESREVSRTANTSKTKSLKKQKEPNLIFRGDNLKGTKGNKTNIKKKLMEARNIL